MDRRIETTLMKSLAAATALALLTCVPVWAQPDPEGEPQVDTSTQATTQATTEGTNIFGNQELPKGLTIVPWKKNAPGQLSDSPTRLVDEPLVPIDPEVFERRLKYYEQTRGQ